ncbi:hypothetical protein BH09SUM1_BH09SUM1_31260 [soil metagenome]
MSYRLEVIFFALLGAAVIFGGARTARRTEVAPPEDAYVDVYRRWETTMPIDGEKQTPFFISLHQDPLGRTTVTCDLPGLGIKDIQSDAAVMTGNEISFRNRLGRFQGRDDFSLNLLLSKQEFSETGEPLPVVQFYCEPIQ